jgi:hypothetical protein
MERTVPDYREEKKIDTLHAKCITEKYKVKPQ